MSHGANDDTALLLERVFASDGDIDITEHEIGGTFETLPNLWNLLEAERKEVSLLLRQWKSVVKTTLSDDSSLHVRTDCVTKRITVHLVETWLIYFPLCLWIVRRCREKATGDRSRLVVGVGGSAAAGKTTFCCIVAAFLNQLFNDDGCRCQLVGMDAYHLTNKALVESGLRHLKVNLCSGVSVFCS